MWLVLTGSTGFVGRNLLLQWVKSGTYEKIILPVRSAEKLRAQFLGDGFDAVPEMIQAVEGGAHSWNVKSVLASRPAKTAYHLVHCASTMFGRSRHEYFSVNVDGTRRLMEDTADAAATVVLSSLAAAGPCVGDQLAKKECDPYAPVTLYGESKQAMEEFLFKEFSKRALLVIRPPMVLGARDSASLALFRMARMPVRFKPGGNERYYSFIAVDDLVSAIRKALERTDVWSSLPRGPFYVSSEHTITGTELIETAGKTMGKGGMTLRVPIPLLKVASNVVDAVPLFRELVPTLTKDRAKDIWPDRWVVSAAAFGQAFNWRAESSLESSLEDALQWYRRTKQI